MTERALKRGLYVITDSHLLNNTTLVSSVEKALKGGAVVVQYRDKIHSDEERLAQAIQLKQLCDKYSVPLIINDDIALAKSVDAAGVHLGKDDMNISKAREILGEKSIIGISCYNQFELAKKAVANGADYIAFGAFFPSKIKEKAVRADTSLLKQAKEQFSIPVVAIGGITIENGAFLVESGADQLAVISALFDNIDTQKVAEQFTNLFNYNSTGTQE
jgi:thiamine-phosphate pyrophosphorylase